MPSVQQSGRAAAPSVLRPGCATGNAQLVPQQFHETVVEPEWRAEEQRAAAAGAAAAPSNGGS